MTDKIEKILVAIDFSEPAFNALHTAVCLAEKHDANLYILHAEDNMLESISLNRFTAGNNIQNTSDILNALAADINKRSGIQPAILLEKGYACEMILKNAVKLSVDLIVIGANGVSGHRNGYAGTVAYTVIKYAPCPVLLIPPGQKSSSFKKPLFPVRPMMTAARYHNILRNFVEQHASLQMLGLLSSEKEDTVADLQEFVTEMQVKFSVDSIGAEALGNKNGYIPHAVLSQADKNNSDLIIITPAIDLSIKQFYIGPNAHYIIHNTKIPLLIVNRRSKYSSRSSL